jgi:hypothetical protein
MPYDAVPRMAKAINVFLSQCSGYLRHLQIEEEEGRASNGERTTRSEREED